MARIVIFGGTGYAGGNIAAEAVKRGHSVVSYSRSLPEQPLPGVEYRTGSITDTHVLGHAGEEADELVVATHGADVSGQKLVDVLPKLVATALAHDARLSFVGGAGSSLVAEGGPRLIDTPDFQEEWKPEAAAHAEVLDALYRTPEQLRWFYVSPAALFGAWAPGETTGSYRTGGDLLVTKEDGSSEISGTDFATAYVDEIEQSNHPRRRFTVGH
ncbi:NAD(P)-dependent oxidoreductase [Nocardioides sp.]|jgi:putative NADH-flavin reductase|uniref:NAD(P)-dependent oxidoreductase n=1 Tax=Nocardioides sp. TaxID=35761 RepID=UPI002C60DAA4|nr:NAD(P)H-binding protein [Nocardioides sp.]HVX56017.1 NAD(P)H-binding protein [Nocardioides sp.]